MAPREPLERCSGKIRESETEQKEENATQNCGRAEALLACLFTVLRTGLYISFLSIYSLVTFLNDKHRDVPALWRRTGLGTDSTKITRPIVSDVPRAEPQKVKRVAVHTYPNEIPSC